MLSEEAVGNLVRALSKRASTNSVEWTQLAENKFGVDLHDFTVGLSPLEPNRPEAGILFEVEAPSGSRVSTIPVRDDDPKFADVRQLFDSANSYMQDWNRRLLNAAKIIEGTTGTIGGSVVSVSLSPPPPPPRPTDAQARAFFEKITGKWELEFEKRDGSVGLEWLEIDRAGNYLTNGQPRFRFALVSCDEQLEEVDVAKEELNGRVRQVEVLTISSMAMVGYAKHDERSLRYKWNVWFDCRGGGSKRVQLRAKNPNDAVEVYKRAMGIISSVNVTVMDCPNHKPSAADLELDKALYPTHPFSKEA